VTRLGMDADVVERQGVALQREAERVRQLVRDVDQVTRSLNGTWFGQKASRFADNDWPAARIGLHDAAEAIEGLGRSAVNNAAEQRRASAAGATYQPMPSSIVRMPGFSGGGGGGGGGWGDDSWSAVDSIRRALGNITVDEDGLHQQQDTGHWQAEFQREGHWSGDLGGAQATADAEFRARAEAGTYRTMDIGPDGVQAGVGGYAEASAVATGSASLALGAAQLKAQGSAYAKARVEATAGVGIGPDGAHAGAKAGAQAAAGVSGEVSADIAGVKGTAEGTLEVGLDAHAQADVNVSMKEVHVTVDAGVALGIGGGVQFDVSVNPEEVLHNVQKFFPDPPKISFPWR